MGQLSVRLYALAKELQLDSEELVDLCRKAGIRGKGSALAPLDDGEVSRVTQYLRDGSIAAPLKPSAASRKPNAPAVPPRAGSIPDTGTTTRIYALAKELQLDSKDLVDACARAGITGKASALAPLTQSEVAKVKAHLNAQPTVEAPKPSPTPRSPSPTAESPDADSRAVNVREEIASTTVPMCLGNALAIDSLHVQVTELGAIVETLILKVLDTSGDASMFRGESNFCDLIDDAFDGDVFASLTADELHTARMNRNKIAHRSNGIPNQSELRRSRNAFVLAILDLLEYCGESLKAEILSEFAQHFPQNKRMHRSTRSGGNVRSKSPAHAR